MQEEVIIKDSLSRMTEYAYDLLKGRTFQGFFSYHERMNLINVQPLAILLDRLSLLSDPTLKRLLQWA